MPTQVTEFKCPACTAPLHFSEETGRLECDYCGSSFTVAEAEAFSAEKEQQAAEAFEKAAAEARADAGSWERPDGQDSWGEEADHLKTYRCPSCGAELICDEATAATSCPYCGNNTIISGQFHGMQKPELVIPFKLGKEEAVKTLKAHYKGRPFLPKSFSDENHIQEIKGIYVPFWLFDGQAEADVRFTATRSSVMVTARERITTTRYFDVRRAGTVKFEKIPVDASRKMPWFRFPPPTSPAFLRTSRTSPWKSAAPERKSGPRTPPWRPCSGRYPGMRPASPWGRTPSSAGERCAALCCQCGC